MGNFLFESMMVQCHMMDRVSVTGPFGVEMEYREGAAFMAAIVKDNSLPARVAEKDGMKQVYTIVADPGASLDFHDIVKRDEDGATFRVTSSSIDSSPPKVASFNFVQVNAERWDIPTK